MKQLTRPSCPATEWSDDKGKKGYYENLRNTEGKIKPRWNTLQQSGRKIIREELRAMSGDCCCFCGCKVSGSKMQVDHYLPSSEFPYLAYCWDNLLPTCIQCNNKYKGTLIPEPLKGKKIIESCMVGHVDHDHIYEKKTILELAGDARIIDPTHDTVNQHLGFDPGFFKYKAKTPIGTQTNKVFFDRKEVVGQLEGISNIAKGLVVDGCSFDRIKDMVEAFGYEFYFHAFYDYWLAEQAAGRIR